MQDVLKRICTPFMLLGTPVSLLSALAFLVDRSQFGAVVTGAGVAVVQMPAL